ncbi:hypothetical protein GT2_35_00300 [Parageobacillus thermoglucosidasius NBRC 107763]|nr:hypothetical protein GT2_35_00300 [Parageobacillus thermoglucosidasius NBRC 107763]
MAIEKKVVGDRKATSLGNNLNPIMLPRKTITLIKSMKYLLLVNTYTIAKTICNNENVNINKIN